MFSRSSATGATTKVDEVSALCIWRERLQKEARQQATFAKHTYAPNPHSIVLLPEKPNNVSFESRIPRAPSAAPSSSSASAPAAGPRSPLAAAGLSATSSSSTYTASIAAAVDSASRRSAKEGEKPEAAAVRQQLFQTMHRSMLPPQEKSQFPASSNQEYGWFSKPLVPREPPAHEGGFHRGLKSSEVTQFADSYTLNWGKSPFLRPRA
jgi:hypothetical protein